MPGGLLNLIAVGQQNIILNGTPKKTFWKSSYSKYTNFGLQKFRLDFDGLRKLRLNDKSQFTFKFPRYADLVMDTYLVVTLPHIWSPLFPIKDNSELEKEDCNTYYIPYNFKWIENLGTQMIDSIEVNVGGTTLQKYSGDYLTSMMSRDFSHEKKELINQMTGDVKELNDPKNAESNFNKSYPNAVYNTSKGGAEPSIRGKTLYIPLNLWFCLTSKQAFPLVALQYNELTVTVTMKSIKELFVIRDVKNPYNNYDYIAPNFNEPSDQMFLFLQTPPGVLQDNICLTNSVPLDPPQIMGPPESTEEFYKSYKDKRDVWDADIHLMSTYCFLSDDERRVFAANTQEYLIKQVYEKTFHNVVDSAKLRTGSSGMVSSWMWFARRSDVNIRNQWTNYSNWVSKHKPTKIKVPTNNKTARQPWYYEPSGQDESLQDITSELDQIQYTPYANFQVSLPRKNPYSNCNFNKWQRYRQYDIIPPHNETKQDYYQTILDQPGFYPPSTDIICDNFRGPYIDAAEVNSANGLFIEPVWKQQGSINTNYPIYAPRDLDANSDNIIMDIIFNDEKCLFNIYKLDSSDPSGLYIVKNGEYESIIGLTVKVRLYTQQPTQHSSNSGDYTDFYGTITEIYNVGEKQSIQNLANAMKLSIVNTAEHNNQVANLQAITDHEPEFWNHMYIDMSNNRNFYVKNDQGVSSYHQKSVGAIFSESSNYPLDHWDYINCVNNSDPTNLFKNTNYPCGEKYDGCVVGDNNTVTYYGNWWGSPYDRTVFPLAWGSAQTMPGPFSTSGKFSVENNKNIISTAGILLDGKYRENLFRSGVYEYIEKVNGTNGGGPDGIDGLLCYNFCLNTNPFELQPSGAINMSRFSNIEIELTTHTPPIDKLAQYANICTDVTNADGSVDKVQIGVNKPSWNIYEYTYDIHLMEERYNIVTFTGGNVGLMFAR